MAAVRPGMPEAPQSLTLRQGTLGTCHPSPPSTAQEFGTTKKYNYIFILEGHWGEVGRKQPLTLGPSQWQLLVP